VIAHFGRPETPVAAPVGAATGRSLLLDHARVAGRRRLAGRAAGVRIRCRKREFIVPLTAVRRARGHGERCQVQLVDAVAGVCPDVGVRVFQLQDVVHPQPDDAVGRARRVQPNVYLQLVPLAESNRGAATAVLRERRVGPRRNVGVFDRVLAVRVDEERQLVVPRPARAVGQAQHRHALRPAGPGDARVELAPQPQPGLLHLASAHIHEVAEVEVTVVVARGAGSERAARAASGVAALVRDGNSGRVTEGVPFAQIAHIEGRCPRQPGFTRRRGGCLADSERLAGNGQRARSTAARVGGHAVADRAAARTG
jgi:hypothetical protein